MYSFLGSLLALSASARPVEVNILPQKFIHFGACVTGNTMTKTIEVKAYYKFTVLTCLISRLLIYLKPFLSSLGVKNCLIINATLHME